MFEKDSYVIYKRDVCKITDIFKSKINNTEYYRLSPISDESLKISVPTENKNGYLKRLLTKEEIEKLIDNIPNIMPVEADSRSLDNVYKELFHSGNHEDLMQDMIDRNKNTYGDLRNGTAKKPDFSGFFVVEMSGLEFGSP